MVLVLAKFNVGELHVSLGVEARVLRHALGLLRFGKLGVAYLGFSLIKVRAIGRRVQSLFALRIVLKLTS